jgi:di/tricarboxylate transporter
MSIELASILVLAAIFLVATVSPIHLGALAISAAFILGMFVLPGTSAARVDSIVSGFPGDLFIVLTGVTFLFAIARKNGTVDWLVDVAMRAARGRVSLVPWVMFFVTAIITAVGAAGPAAVAMIAPIGNGLARRYHLNPVPVGLMVVNGASAGSFSPIGIFGLITNNVVQRNGLAGSPLILFAASMIFNIILGVILVAVFGWQDRRGDLAGLKRPTDRRRACRHAQSATCADPHGLMALTVGALFFGLDVGFSAFVVAVLLSACDPEGAKGATTQIAWSTTLLVCGIVTYVSLMQTLGTVNYLGSHVAAVGSALTGALLICYIGGFVSAFASTTGILGTLIPLAVPFLERQQVSAIGLITRWRSRPLSSIRAPSRPAVHCRGECARRSARSGLPEASAVGFLDGRACATDRLADSGRSGLAVSYVPGEHRLALLEKGTAPFFVVRAVEALLYEGLRLGVTLRVR